MNTYIVLLKGINVGGHKKLPMADLRELMTKIGFQDVKTYIQSGNIILKTLEDKTAVEGQIYHSILDQFGYEVSVIVKTRDELKRVFDDCPFPDEQKKATYFTLLHDKPSEALITEASKKQYESDTYRIINDGLYLYSENGMGKSKFNMNFFERKLETIGTTRNYNTMVKLLSLSTEM